MLNSFIVHSHAFNTETQKCTQIDRRANTHTQQRSNSHVREIVQQYGETWEVSEVLIKHF